jgi:hypothetical protein
MKAFIFCISLLAILKIKGQVQPFVDYDWTIEQIDSANNGIIFADPNNPELMSIYYSDIFLGYGFTFPNCGGFFNFDDANQTYDIQAFETVITPTYTTVSDEFVNVFILQDAGSTSTANGIVYGPFSYSFSYSDSGDKVYLHIDNQAGSIATFFASTLSVQNFLKNKVFIYPNPVQDILKIESARFAVKAVKLYDLNGRLVEEFLWSNQGIDVSQLSRGVYILSIETSKGVLQEKVIKVD